jgi:hypothetical protein
MVDMLANACRALDRIHSDTATADPQAEFLRRLLADFVLVKRAFARAHSRRQVRGGRRRLLAFELVATLTLVVTPATRGLGQWSVAALEAADVCRLLRIAARKDDGNRNLLLLVPICWALIRAHPLLNDRPMFVRRDESVRQACAVNDVFAQLQAMRPLPSSVHYAAGVLAAIGRPRDARHWVGSALHAARVHGAAAFVRFFRPFVEAR